MPEDNCHLPNYASCLKTTQNLNREYFPISCRNKNKEAARKISLKHASKGNPSHTMFIKLWNPLLQELYAAEVPVGNLSTTDHIVFTVCGNL